jgi:hypothetical protein
MENTVTLHPVDGRKSFYNKCKVIRKGNKAVLVSYSTEVAEYDYKTGEIKINGWYSRTTARHINSFLTYFGFDIMAKKEMEA